MHDIPTHQSLDKVFKSFEIVFKSDFALAMSQFIFKTHPSHSRRLLVTFSLFCRIRAVIVLACMENMTSRSFTGAPLFA